MQPFNTYVYVLTRWLTKWSGITNMNYHANIFDIVYNILAQNIVITHRDMD